MMARPRTTNVLLLTVLALAFSSLVSTAATVTDAYAQPTNLGINDDSNHKFVITVADGVAEGASLVLTFPSSFDTSSITEDDVDIDDDGVDRTTASDCTGSEEVGIDISSGVFTFTVCSGDGGLISSGSEVIIEIGVNATASGTGSNQITNPSNAATYFVNISGTFSGSGSIPIPIVEEDNASVSGVVGGSSGGGDSGGGPTGGGDDGGGDDDPGDDDPGDDDPGDDDPGDDDPGDDDPGDDDPGDDTDPGDGGGDDDPGDEDPGDGGGSSDPGGSTPSSGDGDGSGDPPDERDVETEVSVDDLVLGDGDADVLPDTEVDVSVEIGDAEDVGSAEIIIDDEAYPLELTDDGDFVATVPTPSRESDVTVVVEYDDGQTVTEVYEWGVEDVGLVYEELDGEIVPVDGAVVIVYEEIASLATQWDAAEYGQSNPVVVGESGTFSWYVPNGDYTVTVGKSGYEDAELSVRVTNNILAVDIELVREAAEEIVEEDPEEEPAVVAPPEEPQDQPPTITETVESVVETITEILDSPQAEAVAEVAAPVAVVSVAASAGVLASSFNLLNFLQYLFSSPILFFARRRRQAFGVVYNGITKVPVDLAITRLYREDGRLVRTMVTDKEGRYFFKADPGRYTIKVTKKGFEFPSEYVKGVQDGKYLDVYTGGTIEVTEANVTIAASIPVDPSQREAYHAPRRLIFMRFLRVFQHVLAISGVLLALVVVVINPGLLTVGLLIVHVGIYTLTRLLTRVRKAKGWGIVSATHDSKPIANTVVRLFEPKYNKLIESTLTDSKGRYAFLAGSNEYYVTYEKPGFEKQEVRDIDYSDKKQSEVISVDVEMKKQDS